MGLIFNGRTGPFTDPRVRQAVGFAIRRDEIVKAAFFGRGAPLEGIPLTPGTPFFDEARSHHWRYDPDRAKKLLAEAGMSNGFQCTLLSTAQYGMHKQTAEIVQQHLAEIGIQAKLNLPDWATRLTLGGRGQYDFAVVGDSALTPDPDGIAFLLDAELPESIIAQLRHVDARGCTSFSCRDGRPSSTRSAARSMRKWSRRRSSKRPSWASPGVRRAMP